MAGKTTETLTLFSQKKLLGKAHTSNLKLDGNEAIGSAVQLASSRIFGEAVPTNPSLTLNVQQGVGSGVKTVEYVEFDVVAISGTTYDANVTGGGSGTDSGESLQIAGPHGYQFQLKSTYESDTDDNRGKAGNGVFDDSKVLHETLGALQIVPTSFSGESDNPYVVKIYKNDGNPLGPTNQIGIADNIDWQIDTFNGVLFVQDFDSTKIDTLASPPLYARAFIYVGDMLDDVVTAAAASGGSGGSGGGGREKRDYEVTTTVSSGSAFSVSNSSFQNSAFDITLIDVFHNGNLLLSGTDAQVGTGDVDYFVFSNNQVKFGFDLFADDIVSVVTYNSGSESSSGGSDSGAQYLVLSATGSLSNERVLNPGTGLSGLDAGAGGNFTLSIDDSVVATISGSTFTGAVKFNEGLSGSLTQLTDGTSYIQGSTGINVSSASNGAITLKVNKEMVFNELLSGIANGTNTLFTLANTPFASNEISIFVNGQLQTPPDLTSFQDYSVTGSNVYFTTSSIPEMGSLVMAMYNKVVS